MSRVFSLPVAYVAHLIDFCSYADATMSLGSIIIVILLYVHVTASNKSILLLKLIPATLHSLSLALGHAFFPPLSAAGLRAVQSSSKQSTRAAVFERHGLGLVQHDGAELVSSHPCRGEKALGALD